MSWPRTEFLQSRNRDVRMVSMSQKEVTSCLCRGQEGTGLGRGPCSGKYPGSRNYQQTIAATIWFRGFEKGKFQFTDGVIGLEGLGS